MTFDEWVKTEDSGDVQQLERAWRAGRLALLQTEKIMQVQTGIGGDERPFLVVLTTYGRIFSGAVHGQVWEETQLPKLKEGIDN